MDSLRELARELEVPERTLRRAAGEGLIRGERISPRRFRTSVREYDYLRRYWPVLSQLRAALRTEPNVRLGVLFGSFATGDASERSDADLLVELADAGTSRLADLGDRLTTRLGRDVQLVRRQEAEQSPLLMAAVLEHGRVLIDRDGLWQSLKSDEARWQRRARQADRPLDEAMSPLGLDGTRDR